MVTAPGSVQRTSTQPASTQRASTPPASTDLRACGPVRVRPAAGPRGAARAALALLRRFAPNWLETPFTCGYLAVVGAATLFLATLGRADRLAVLHQTSTDVHNLMHHPLLVLAVSGLWVQSIGDYLVIAVVLGVAGAFLERRVGTRATFAIFATGHVVATLVTEGAVGLGVHTGVLPASALTRLDVGVSYGLVAVLAAAVGFAPLRWRVLAVAAALLAIAHFTQWDLRQWNMTHWGHLIALGLGVAWWPGLRSLRDRDRASSGDALGAV